MGSRLGTPRELLLAAGCPIAILTRREKVVMVIIVIVMVIVIVIIGMVMIVIATVVITITNFFRSRSTFPLFQVHLGLWAILPRKSLRAKCVTANLAQLSLAWTGHGGHPAARASHVPLHWHGWHRSSSVVKRSIKGAKFWPKMDINV